MSTTYLRHVKCEVADRLGMKEYISHYADCGIEIGFGGKARYPAHAHLYYTDVLFAPDGLICRDAAGLACRGRLLVVPPRTWFEVVEISAFGFLKFSTAPVGVVIPDKVADLLSESSLQCFGDTAELAFPWFVDATSPPKEISLMLGAAGLTIRLGDWRVEQWS